MYHLPNNSNKMKERMKHYELKNVFVLISDTVRKSVSYETSVVSIKTLNNASTYTLWQYLIPVRTATSSYRLL